MEKVKITFVNGTTVDAEVNGSCYITAKKPEFPDDLSKVTVKIGDETKELVEVEVNEAASVDGRYWFALLELSEAQLEEITNTAHTDTLEERVEVVESAVMDIADVLAELTESGV